MSNKIDSITKNDLELLFSNNYSVFDQTNYIVKKAEAQSSNSIGSIDETALNSIQNLFDSQYKKGGHKESLKYGKELFKGFNSPEVMSIINAQHEKQITGEIMAKIMQSDTAMGLIKNIDPPKDTGKENKGAVVSIMREAWESIKRNINVLGQILGGACTEAWKAISESKSLYAGIGLAIWALWKYFGRHLSKIFKFLKFIPGLSIVIDISLAIKNIYYIQKEIMNDDWNKTMEEIEQPMFMVPEPTESPKINYPNSIARVIGEGIDGLTEKIRPAFNMGVVALKCSVAGFHSAKIFNQILEDKEKAFLSGQISSEEFALSVAKHIKASRKIKLVCSEMIGLSCNVTSALFDIVGAFIGIGTLISIIGNLVIAGIDMSIREAVIISGKTFEDFWSKKIMDYRQMFLFSFNFANDADKRLSGDSSNNDFNKEVGLLEVKENLVDKETIEKENQKAFDEAREEQRKKKAG